MKSVVGLILLPIAMKAPWLVPWWLIKWLNKGI